MNIAFGTIVLFIIIVPGLILRRTYYSAEFSKNFIKNSLVDEVIFSVVPSLFLHFLAIILIHCLTCIRIDFDSISILLMGSSQASEVKTAFASINNNLGKIFFYNFFLWLIAGMLGFILRYQVRRKKWDRKYKFIRYNNEWHYLLTGEILDFPNIKDRSEDIDLKYVDALIKVDSRSIIYSGIVVDYNLSEKGSLDSIVLRDVRRRNLTGEQDEAKKEKYEMPGHFFVIFYTQIININLTYYKLTEEVVEEGLDIEPQPSSA